MAIDIQLDVEARPISFFNKPETKLLDPLRAEKKSRATRLLLERNKAINELNPTATRLVEKDNKDIHATAEQVVDFCAELKKYGGSEITKAFLADDYILLWMEQIIELSPQKVAMAIDTRMQVDRLFQQNRWDAQYVPAVALGAFVATEKLDDLGLTYAPTRTAIEQIQKILPTETQSGQRVLLGHLIEELTFSQAEHPNILGKDRGKQLIQQISEGIYKRLIEHSKVDKILEQSQGIEVEVLGRLENIPPAMRTDPDVRYRLERAEKLGIAETWLPRGLKKEKLRRTDWHLTHMLGLPEDNAEKKTEWFEISTHPTSYGSAQATMIHELTLGGFIDETKVNNSWESYSLHTSTLFPSSIWDYNADAQHQYLIFSRGFAGAFASTQRGVYVGYIYYDSNVGEIYDKTLGMKLRPIVGRGSESTEDQRLVEIRNMDITPTGQNAFEIHKPFFDYAFKCHWRQQLGEPLRNNADYQAANIWREFYGDLDTLLKKYGIEDAWYSVGWTKAQKPELAADLQKLYRKHAGKIRVSVDQEVKSSTEQAYPNRNEPVISIGKRPFQIERSSFKDHTSSLIHVSEFDAQQMGLSDGQFITFRFGEHIMSSAIHVERGKASHGLHVQVPLSESLNIPSDTELSFHYDPIRREFAAGPVVGTIATIEDASLREPFGTQTEYHRRLHMSAKKAGMFMFSFDPKSIDTEANTLDGITLESDGKTWTRVRMPYPDYLFNRNFDVFPEKNRVALSHIPQINSESFVYFLADKLEIMEIHSRNPSLRSHIPETVAFTGSESLESMVKRNKVVYLKPQFGMKSIGVIRVSKNPTENGYLYNFTQLTTAPDTEEQYYSWATESDVKAKTIPDVLAKTAHVRTEYRDYIVQQGIDMPKDNDGDTFEIRFLFQRNENGKLALVGWHEGQKEHWIENFKRYFGTAKEPIITGNLELLAKAVALNTQREFGSHFGQMTVQIGMDRTGTPWLLEQNPLPGVTNQFNAYGIPHITGESTDQLLQYALGISGFKETSSSPKTLEQIQLPNGLRADVFEEINPLTIYQFAQASLGNRILNPKTSVYNLFSIDRIKRNIADGTRYIMIQANGKTLGCISIMKPAESVMIDTSDSSLPMVDSRMRWEIGGVLTSPEARGQGIASRLFETAINEIRKVQPVRNHGLSNRLGYDVYVDEIRVQVTGNYDPKTAGIARADSVGIEKIVQHIPGGRKIGAVFGSYGPLYVIPITSQKKLDIGKARRF